MVICVVGGGWIWSGRAALVLDWGMAWEDLGCCMRKRVREVPAGRTQEPLSRMSPWSPQEPLPGGARVRVGGAQGLKELDGSKVDAEVILDMTEEAILLLQFGWMDVMGMANQGRGRVAVGCEGGQGRCEGGWMNTVYKFICSLQLDPVREIVLLHATSLLFARKWVCAWVWVWEWAWARACWPLCD